MLIKLTTEAGKTPIREIRLHIKETVIGRGPECNLHVRSSQVSRKHCLLSFNHGCLSVQDLGSANGTYLNGQRLDAKAHVVHPGDVLGFGPLAFAVDYDPNQEETEEEATAARARPAPLGSKETAQSVLDVTADQPAQSIPQIAAEEANDPIDMDDLSWSAEKGGSDLRDFLSNMGK